MKTQLLLKKTLQLAMVAMVSAMTVTPMAQATTLTDSSQGSRAEENPGTGTGDVEGGFWICFRRVCINLGEEEPAFENP